MNSLRRLLIAFLIASAIPLSLRGFAATWVEPGSDDCACVTKYTTAGTVASTTAQAHTGPRSISMTGASNSIKTAASVLADAGSRCSWWYRNDTLSTGDQVMSVQNATPAAVYNLRTPSSGTARLEINKGGTTLATGTTALSTNTWYRISVGYTITTTTNFTIKYYLNGGLEATCASCGTLTNTGSSALLLQSGGTSINAWADDVYCDNGTGNSEPGEGNTGTMALTIGMRGVTGVR